MALFGGDNRINATFTASDKATPVIKTLRSNVSSLGTKTGGPLGGLLGGLGSVTASSLLMGGAIGAAAGFMAQAAKAAIDDQQNVDHLTASLKANVPGWDGATDAVDDFIKKGQDLAFTDDDIRDSISQLVTRTHDVTKAINLTRQAMDLARLRGISLATAGDIIGKVYGGNIGILSRYGIAVKKGSTATEALSQIQKAAAGQAEKYAESTQGTLDKTADKFGEAVESLGYALLPAVKSLADSLVFAIDQVGNLGTAFDNLHRFIDPNYKLLGDTDQALSDLARKYGLNASAIVGFAQANRQAAEDQKEQQRITLAQSLALEHYNNLNESYADIAAKFGVQIGDVTAAVLQYGDAAAASATATDQNAEATKEANRTLAAFLIQQRLAANVAYAQEAATRKATTATQGWFHAVHNAGTGLKQFTHDNEQAVRNFEAAWRGAAINSKQTVHKLGGSIQSEIKSWKDPIRAAMAADAWAMKHPFSERELADWLEGKMNTAQKRLHRAIKRGDTATVSEITHTIALIQSEIDSLHGTTVPIKIISQGGSHGGPIARASGGPTSRAATYIVGENGPETLHLFGGGGGYVTQGRGGGGGGAPPVIHTHVYLDGREIATAVDRRQGQTWTLAGSSSTRN